MLEEPEEDPATMSTSEEDDDDLSASTSTHTDDWQSPFSGKRHHISRVVIRHHDTLATFYDASSLDKEHCPAESLSAVGVGGAPHQVKINDSIDTTQESEDFFDNDSFWSGSITWY